MSKQSRRRGNLSVSHHFTFYFVLHKTEKKPDICHFGEQRTHFAHGLLTESSLVQLWCKIYKINLTYADFFVKIPKTLYYSPLGELVPPTNSPLFLFS